jgi:hypothetical protein
MTLDEAIEVLQDLLGEGPYFRPEKRIEAVKLGIEALKRWKNFRDNSQTFGYSPLPGETEE